MLGIFIGILFLIVLLLIMRISYLNTDVKRLSEHISDCATLDDMKELMKLKENKQFDSNSLKPKQHN
jgi:hypothetical protein